MDASNQIILASASPRRQAFLQALAIPFVVHTADIDETPLPNEAPTNLVRRLSRQKAQAVATHYPKAFIIGADTIVVLNNRILGKPASPAEARRMLLAHRGKSHRVLSAISVYSPHQMNTALSDTLVTMRHYSEAELDAYVATGDSLDKAGAYAIQHAGFSPVATIDGCYAGVMGFPIKALLEVWPELLRLSPSMARLCTAFTGQPCCLAQKSA